MTTTVLSEEARHGIGGNNPPEVTIVDRLKEAYAKQFAEVDDIAELANGAPKELENEDQVAAVTDIAASAGAARKTLDDARKIEKDPFLQGGRDVDNTFRDPIDRCERIDKALMGRVTAFRRKQAEAERSAREQAEREAREAAAAAQKAAEEAMKAGRTDDAMADLADATHANDLADEIAQTPSIAEPSRIQTASGLTAGTRTEWAFEITDYDAIPLDKLRALIKRDAIEAAIRQAVRNGTRDLTGVRIFEDVKATRRR